MDNDSNFQQPTPEQLKSFVIGDPIAIDEVVTLLLPQIVRWAFSKYDYLPRDEIQSEIHLVFAETCRRHAEYIPEKSLLSTYIINIVKLRMKDLYRRNTQDVQLLDESDYENISIFLYNLINNQHIDTKIDREQFFEKASTVLEEHEKEFLRLMKQGVKSTADFTRILEQYDIPINDAQKAVKNCKERLMRKLKNFVRVSGYRLKDL